MQQWSVKETNCLLARWNVVFSDNYLNLGLKEDLKWVQYGVFTDASTHLNIFVLRLNSKIPPTLHLNGHTCVKTLVRLSQRFPPVRKVKRMTLCCKLIQLR